MVILCTQPLDALQIQLALQTQSDGYIVGTPNADVYIVGTPNAIRGVFSWHSKTQSDVYRVAKSNRLCMNDAPSAVGCVYSCTAVQQKDAHVYVYTHTLNTLHTCIHTPTHHIDGINPTVADLEACVSKKNLQT